MSILSSRVGMLSPKTVANAMTAAMTEIITSTFDINTANGAVIAIAHPAASQKPSNPPGDRLRTNTLLAPACVRHAACVFPSSRPAA